MAITSSENKPNGVDTKKKESLFNRLRKIGLIASGILFFVGGFGYPALTEAALGDLGVVDPIANETYKWLKEKKAQLTYLFTGKKTADFPKSSNIYNSEKKSETPKTYPIYRTPTALPA